MFIAFCVNFETSATLSRISTNDEFDLSGDANNKLGESHVNPCTTFCGEYKSYSGRRVTAFGDVLFSGCLSNKLGARKLLKITVGKITMSTVNQNTRCFAVTICECAPRNNNAAETWVCVCPSGPMTDYYWCFYFYFNAYSFRLYSNRRSP